MWAAKQLLLQSFGEHGRLPTPEDGGAKHSQTEKKEKTYRRYPSMYSYRNSLLVQNCTNHSLRSLSLFQTFSVTAISVSVVLDLSACVFFVSLSHAFQCSDGCMLVHIKQQKVLH